VSDILDTAPPHVYTAIAEVMGELAKVGIGKNNKNAAQGYKFRGIDDVYNALAPQLARARLLVLPRVLNRTVTERETKNGGVLFYVVLDVEFDFVSAQDGSKHTVRMIGEAMDSGDKASNKAMSAAYKYACMEAFCIPTEGDNDADGTTHEVTAKPGVRVVDPRGEPHERSDFDPVERDKYVSRFMDAMQMDKEEEERAAAVYAIHMELAGKNDLYIAIADAIAAQHGTKFKNAIRKYVDMHKKQRSAA
jgi:hypothetical protein